jgi:hypothetical protein
MRSFKLGAGESSPSPNSVMMYVVLDDDGKREYH